jgi:hypothetical protein
VDAAYSPKETSYKKLDIELKRGSGLEIASKLQRSWKEKSAANISAKVLLRRLIFSPGLCGDWRPTNVSPNPAPLPDVVWRHIRSKTRLTS